MEGTVVGFCALHPVQDDSSGGRVGEIAALYVLPSYWRRGIGRHLWERALDVARRRGFSQVVLWVLESNQRARRFYQALGFRPDGHTRVFFERPTVSLHELRYRRETLPDAKTQKRALS